MVKATDRPCRSVPHPTASWAAVKIIFSSYLIDSNFCQPPEAVGSSNDRVPGGGKKLS
jgi:hypothetical protein